MAARAGRRVQRRARYWRHRSEGRGTERPSRLPLLLLVAWMGAGCVTYSERVAGARSAADGSDYEAAVIELDRVLGVDSTDALPDDIGSEQALALLERGVLLQAEQRFRESARDLSAAERELELLDFTLDGLGAIGEYVYSDSAAVYKAPPSEQLALNALNMLNYLALGDLEGAAVEARRYTTTRQYLDSLVEDGSGATARGALGAWLAGFVFERLGEADRALRYYEEALAAGADPVTLAGPVARLAAIAPYRGPELDALLETAAPAAQRSARGPGSEILVVVSLGRVPYKVPERIPVGAAIAIGGTYVTGNPEWLSRGIAKVVVYPELVPGSDGRRQSGLQVDGETARAGSVDDLAAEVRREYAALKPRIIGAALSRLIVRAAAAEGARQLGRKGDDWVGELVGVLLEAFLVALDKPDTRSWTCLPAHATAVRVPVAAGTHQVDVQLEGEPPRRVTVTVPERGFAAVVVTAPR